MPTLRDLQRHLAKEIREGKALECVDRKGTALELIKHITTANNHNFHSLGSGSMVYGEVAPGVILFLTNSSTDDGDIVPVGVELKSSRLRNNPPLDMENDDPFA